MAERSSTRFYRGRTPKPIKDDQAFAVLAPGNYRRIARASGLSLQHVSRVLRGLSGVSFTVAIQVADAAGVSLEQLRAYRAMSGADRPKRRVATA